MFGLSAEIAEIFSICELDAYMVIEKANKTFMAKLNNVINAKTYLQACRFAATEGWKNLTAHTEPGFSKTEEGKVVNKNLDDLIHNAVMANTSFTQKKLALTEELKKLLM